MTDTIPNSITSHVVIVISTFIGHIRPHSNLCFNLLKLHKGMYITLIHHAIHNEVVATELKRQELEEDVTKRLNIVSMGTAVGFNLDPVVEMPGCMAELAMGFPAAYANSFNVSSTYSSRESFSHLLLYAPAAQEDSQPNFRGL